MNSVRGTARESGETTRHLRVLFIAILVIPVALIIASAWLNYDAAFRGAHDRVAHAADAIHEAVDVIKNFNTLTTNPKQDLLNFLRSL